MNLIRVVNPSNEPAKSEDVYVARAVTPLRVPSQERTRAFTEEQPLPSQRRTDLMAPSTTGIWSLIPYVALCSSLTFVAWLGMRRLKAHQARLVNEYGEVMVYYGDTTDSMRQISSEYKRKLGPGVLRGALYSSFLRNLVTEKPVGPIAIQNAAIVKKLLRINDGRAVEVVNKLGEELQSSPSLLGKLLFLAERLLPFKHLPSLKLVPLFPYGSGTVVELQRNMVERCFRELVERHIDEHGTSEAPMDAAKMLRLEESDAKSIFDGVVATRREKEAESAAIAAAEAEDASKPVVEELDHPARSGEPAKVAVHAYQCTICGYTMFPAAGREFKFYGADFVCPACGAPKDKFVDLNAEEQ